MRRPKSGKSFPGKMPKSKLPCIEKRNEAFSKVDEWSHFGQLAKTTRNCNEKVALSDEDRVSKYFNDRNNRKESIGQQINELVEKTEPQVYREAVRGIWKSN